MDDSEKLVEAFLKHCGFQDVRYEPDGNVPPDFLADGRVAVEVRRLNQNHDDGSGRGPRGLEEAAIPLWKQMRDYLLGLGPAPASGECWYVFYRFSRPAPAWKDLKRELDALLPQFMADANPKPFDAKLRVGSEFTVKVFRSPVVKPTFFTAGGNSDEQSGGWLISQIDTNLQLCVSEKTGKIASYRAKYAEWWLVLSDRIGFGLDEFEQGLFLEQVTVQPGAFDKIVLLDPRDAKRAFQVYPKTK